MDAVGLVESNRRDSRETGVLQVNGELWRGRW